MFKKSIDFWSTLRVFTSKSILLCQVGIKSKRLTLGGVSGKIWVKLLFLQNKKAKKEKPENVEEPEDGVWEETQSFLEDVVEESTQEMTVKARVKNYIKFMTFIAYKL